MIIEPEVSSNGYWVGAPSAWIDGKNIFLSARLRRPLNSGRGWRPAIGEPGDGNRSKRSGPVSLRTLNFHLLSAARRFKRRMAAAATTLPMSTRIGVGSLICLRPVTTRDSIRWSEAGCWIQHQHSLWTDIGKGLLKKSRSRHIRSCPLGRCK